MTLKNIKDRFTFSFNRLNIAEKPGLVDWLLFGVIALFAFSSFLYGDIRGVNRRWVELVDALLKGRFFDFHQYVIEKSTLELPSYDMLIYIIFALWNSPLYIIKTVFNVDIFTSYPCLFYFKSMLAAFSAGAGWMLYKICLAMNIKKDAAKWAVFLFFTSAYFFVPVLVIVQYDIICLFFILAGFYFYLKNNGKLFLLFFAIATPLKFFPILVFIPLVLLKEKKILRIVINCGLALSPLAALRILFPGHSSIPVEDSTFLRLTTSALKLFSVGPSLPVFLIIYALVCAYCYFKTPAPEDKNKISSYVCLFIYLTLSMSIAFHPYWILLASPFAVLVIAQNLDKLKLNLLLDAGGMLGLMVWQTQIWHWVYSKNINLYEIGTKLWPISDYKYGSINDLFTKAGLAKYIPIFYALYIGCSAAFLILNFPRKDKDVQQNQEVERGLVLTRFGAPVLIVALNFFIFCIPADQTAISTVDYSALPSPISLDRPSVIKQELVFERDLTLEELQLFCYNDPKSITGRNRYGSLLVSLFEDEKAVFTSKILFHAIPNGATLIDMKNTKVKANKKYTLRLGVRDRIKVGFNIAVVKFPVLGENMPLYINEKRTDMNLYFKLTARPFHEYLKPVKKALVKPDAEISGVKMWISSYDHESIAAAVTVRNAGESAWNKKTGVYLAVQRESNKEWSGEGSLLSEVDINPGEEVVVYVEIKGDQDDRYRFTMIDNSDGKTAKFFGTFSEYYQLPNTAEFIDAKLVWENDSPIAEVKVKNTGGITWSQQSGGATTYIASWAYSDSSAGAWSGNAGIEPGIQVKPGEEYTFRIKLAGGQQPDMAYRFIMVKIKDGQQSLIGNWSDDYRF
ncbi:MAG: hypothetical protein LBD58_07865 [Treponema sp.]|nr:hypothetical protein [Treponema sp.]